MELCGTGQSLHRRDVAERHVRALVVLCPELTRCRLLNLFNRLERALVQPAMAHRPVVALNIGVLLRLARLDMFDPDLPFLRPCQQRMADVFRPIVAADHPGLAA